MNDIRTRPPYYSPPIYSPMSVSIKAPCARAIRILRRQTGMSASRIVEECIMFAMEHMTEEGKKLIYIDCDEQDKEGRDSAAGLL